MGPHGDSRGGGEDKYKNAPDAKHLLDIIGKDVYDEIVKKGEAQTYKEALTGQLSLATASGETADTCDLVEDYYNNRLNRERYPCGTGKEEVKRFSDTQGAECTKSKIKYSDYYRGVCAPFRRLNLCNKNMENMDTNNNDGKAKDNLLLEVCMAAKYEGDSIKTPYTKHELTNPDTKSQLCTVLARSFADIGDIVRGRDLYLGYNETDREKKRKLQQNLKEIFKNIYGNLDKKYRYEGDKNNNYQLREDWWNANRKEVWKAITCSAPRDAEYFIKTACGTGTGTQGRCRCDGDQVPTYFDYVPQYLRWFEEWGEEFCRKRKKQLQNAIKNCRGDNGNDKYCDLNRHDCVETIRGDERFVEKDDCKDCHFSCSHFVKWIDKQKVEFDKQKRKYKSEITGNSGRSSRRKKRSSSSSSSSSYDKGYEKKFYDILKKVGYKDVETFLKKLNDEAICKEHPQVKQEKAEAADFTEEKMLKTFSHTEYCQACPWCGVKEQKGEDGKWEPKKETCGRSRKKNYDLNKTTNIPILTGDKTKGDMVQKYNKFCKNNGGNGATGAPGTANDGAPGGKGGNGAPATAPGKNDNQIVTWQCYYDKDKEDSGQNNNCVEGTWQNFTGKQTVKSYNVFFWDWVHDMLHDSVDWRKQLGRCINNESKVCKKNKCNSDCDCFLNWVKQKENEWKNIVEHFKKQEDIPNECYSTTLEYLFMNEELLQNIKDTHADAEEDEIKNIQNMLEQAGVVGGGTAAMCGTDANSGENKNTSIDKFLREELNDANRCKDCKEPTKPAGDGVAKTGQPRSPAATGSAVPVEEDEDDDEDEDEEETANAEEEGSPKETTQDTVDVCATVKNALTDQSNLTDACKQKYQYGKEKFPNWKCVSSGDSTTTGEARAGRSKRDASAVTTTTSSGVTTERVRGKRSTPETATTSSGDNTGGLCIPPRRRRLYVGKLQEWADKVGDKGESKSQETSDGQKGARGPNGGTEGAGSGPSTSESGDKDPQKALLKAFVESAAVETFFLWHRYKEEKKPPAQEGAGLALSHGQEGSPEEDPEDKLKKGEIPEDFKRQMFYTLGDYRDILFGNTDIVSKASSEDQKDKMNKIQQKIQEHINSGTTTPPTPGTTSGTTPQQTWWEANGEHIWNAMVCALTYTDSEEKGGGGKPKHLEEVYNKFFGENNPGTTGTSNGTQKGTYEKTYKYDKVELKDENSGTMPTTQNTTSGENTPLTDFISRPPYFRYLEEWGQNFCKERKKRLEQIKVDCKVENGERCSGDGESCETVRTQDYTILPSFNCPGCGISCSSYRKWIEKKKIEFTEQENAYDGQKEKCQTQSNGAAPNNGGNGFCKTLNTYSKAAEFLKRLKNGPCKNNNNGADKLDFTNPKETFKHAENCKPCSQFKVNCNGNGACKGANGNTCNKATFKVPGDIGNKENLTEKVDMYVSDESTAGFYDLNDCKNADILKGVREDKWKCFYVCGLDICKPEESNDFINDKEYIQIRALFKRWLEYFLEDYNKIKNKLKPCINKETNKLCINGCYKNCECVGQWIAKKREEWPKIRKRYFEQYTTNHSDIYKVTSFLEDSQFYTEVQKAVKPCGGLKAFESFCGLNDTDPQEKKGGKDGTPKDIVECLLNKLTEKITSCQEQHNGSSQTT
ncbi:hypothetical protein PFTANZ_06515, partial [Plasmodium falciparum Tanzania (2000708)]